MTKKVVLCVPTLTKPYEVTLNSISASVPVIEAAGWDHEMVSEVGCPYVSVARAKMLRKALDAKADVIVFIDHDVSWRPEDLLKLIETEGEVVAGTYRFKQDEIEYMGSVCCHEDGTPIVRDDGCIRASFIPAGFLKITKEAVNKFIEAYPELLFGERHSPSIDLFNHGAHDFVWYGEDYAFSRRWNEKCGEIWLVPDLNIDHHTREQRYEGNFHEFLLKCPGGSNEGI